MTEKLKRKEEKKKKKKDDFLAFSANEWGAFPGGGASVKGGPSQHGQNAQEAAAAAAKMKAAAQAAQFASSVKNKANAAGGGGGSMNTSPTLSAHASPGSANPPNAESRPSGVHDFFGAAQAAAAANGAAQKVRRKRSQSPGTVGKSPNHLGADNSPSVGAWGSQHGSQQQSQLGSAQNSPRDSGFGGVGAAMGQQWGQANTFWPGATPTGMMMGQMQNVYGTPQQSASSSGVGSATNLNQNYGGATNLRGQSGPGGNYMNSGQDLNANYGGAAGGGFFSPKSGAQQGNNMQNAGGARAWMSGQGNTFGFDQTFGASTNPFPNPGAFGYNNFGNPVDMPMRTLNHEQIANGIFVGLLWCFWVVESNHEWKKVIVKNSEQKTHEFRKIKLIQIKQHLA